MQENSQLEGSAHKNLFLQVSKAKEEKDANVRAVCPFSSATFEEKLNVEVDSATSVVGVSKCPGHRSKSGLAEKYPKENVQSVSECPAHSKYKI